MEQSVNARRFGLIAGVTVGLLTIAAAAVHKWEAPVTPGLQSVSPALVPASDKLSNKEPSEADLRQAGADQSWWRTVSADLTRAEYAATPTSGGLQAPNRAQNLRMTFEAHGITVVPRTNKDVRPAWRFVWETTGFGRPGHLAEVGPVPPQVEGDRVTYQREGFCEWYENTAKGLEQGFTIERRPAGEGPLHVVGKVPGGLEPKRRTDGAVDFIDDQGARAIHYGELHVWDARGAELPAELMVADRGLAIVVDDGDAAYPLIVDPLMTSPAWTAESDQAGAFFGISVATAGDVNGDGFSDVIVGAQAYDNGHTDEGKAFVYLGSAAGLALSPAWTAEGDRADARFSVVAPAGDVNGDGFSDVIIGAFQYTNGQNQNNEGRAYVYHGSAAGLGSTAAWTAESDQALAVFGASVGTAGDVNGDGFSDVIVGAYLYDGGQPDEGRAFVYLGSVSGLGSSPAWTAEGNQDGAWFGHYVGTAGDVNGDGFSDVIVGADRYDNGHTNEGRAFVYHGSATGLATSSAWTAEGNQASVQFGYSVATAGDVEGDGFSDVIVGAPSHGAGGRAFVYRGSGLGLDTSFSWTVEGNQGGAAFGTSVGTAGDVNGDGFADVIVGAQNYDNDLTDEGRAFVYLGSALGVSTIPTWTAEGDQASAHFGNSVGTAGDVNGDGFSDVIVGAFCYGQDLEGGAFLYHGSAAGLFGIPHWTADSDQDNAFFGASVATAGDVNGDGFSDVIVGAPSHSLGGSVFLYHGSAQGPGTSPVWEITSGPSNTQWGYSVGTAGDVNGDGLSDVIIGAPSWDNGQQDEGRAFVYLGSTGALVLGWDAEGNRVGAQFGSSVGTAGDVNGDGFSDVIVGAYGFGNGQSREGRAFVYHGSEVGLAATPGWLVESDQDDALLGFSVGTAGDVNGDGFSDVIVGAHGYDNGQSLEGRAFVYHGSAGGLATNPGWVAESDQDNAVFGASVATGGDVNGDGFSDVIVGAPGFTHGQNSEGRAFVYLGSFAGLVLFPDWEVESNQIGANYGISVGTAGDVNGDGFSDVIVGADVFDCGQTDEGRAFVYHGSAASLNFASSWIAESNQATAQFGHSVGTAGDVNGDGFSDVIVGADQYDQGNINEGKAYVYYGNEGDGLHRILRQVRTDGSAPIALLGFSDSPTGFRLEALGRTAGGRGKVRLQREVKPLGTPFDGTGLATGPVFDTGIPTFGVGSAVPLSELTSGLVPETVYHWRLRIVTNSPLFPYSPWISLPYNAASESDLRTAQDVTGIEVAEAPAAPMLLESPRPNPFGPSGEIGYTLPRSGRVRLAVYDVTGREQALLVDAVQGAGRQTITWNSRSARGTPLPAGVYFVRLAFDGRVEVQKLVLAR